MKRTILPLLFATLTLSTVQAKRVNVTQARQVAEQIMAGWSNGKTLKRTNEMTLAYKAVPLGQQATSRSLTQDADFYVFNCGNEKGFIIVAGEDRVHPILGYSPQGHFEIDDLPPNMAAWLKGYQEEIAHIVASEAATSESVAKEWEQFLTHTATQTAQTVSLPYPTALWSQHEPYNRMTPVIDGEHAPTGCVATAMAIVMRYYQYPECPAVGSSHLTYYYVNGSPQETTLEYDGYDWANMRMDYSHDYTESEANAVAELMWHCGANIGMQYTAESSSAPINKIVTALKKVFGYAPSVRFERKENYRWAEWKALINEEIDNGRPVIMDGQEPYSNGHAFVCDGYTTDGAYHINWGWGGRYNGYFLLSTLDYDFDGSGYSNDQNVVVGITPKGNEPILSTPHPHLKALSYRGGVPTENEPLTVNYTFSNHGDEAVTYFMGLAVVDNEQPLSIPIPAQYNIYKFKAGSDGFYFANCQARFTLSTPLSATEYIAVVYATEQSDWKLVPVNPGVSPGIGPDGLIPPTPDEPDEPEQPAYFKMTRNGLEEKFLEATTDGSTESYHNTSYITYEIYGTEGDTWLCFALKDSTWGTHLRAYYGDFLIGKENGGTALAVTDGKWWMPIRSNGDNIGYGTTYMKLLSDQAGKMDYDILLYNTERNKILGMSEGHSVTFVPTCNIYLSPNRLEGETGQPLTLTVTPRINKMIEGRPASLQFIFQYNTSKNVQMDYKVDGVPQPVTYTDGTYSGGGDYVCAEVEIPEIRDGQPYDFTLTFSHPTGNLYQLVSLSAMSIEGKPLPLESSQTVLDILPGNSAGINTTKTAKSLRTWSNGQALCVSAPQDQTISVYGTDGTLLHRFTATTSSIHRFQLPKGCYLVTNGLQTIKAVIP